MKEYQFIISFTDEEIMDIFKEYYPNWEKDSEKYYIDYMIDVMYDYDSFNEFLDNLCCKHEVSNAIYSIIREKIENRY